METHLILYVLLSDKFISNNFHITEIECNSWLWITLVFKLNWDHSRCVYEMYVFCVVSQRKTSCLWWKRYQRRWGWPHWCWGGGAVMPTWWKMCGRSEPETTTLKSQVSRRDWSRVLWQRKNISLAHSYTHTSAQVLVHTHNSAFYLALYLLLYS